jgi:mannose-6-phosphate isomerase-like protein (cupin superfamily)
MSAHAEPDVDRRPWGHFEVLRDAAFCKVKLLVVNPGQRLSLQRHARRAEHWHVVKGRAEIMLDGVTHVLRCGESLDIPRLAWHRLANSDVTELVVVEVQIGEYFGEEDIERGSDDYGR